MTAEPALTSATVVSGMGQGEPKALQQPGLNGNFCGGFHVHVFSRLSSIFIVRGGANCKQPRARGCRDEPNLLVIDNRRIQFNYRLIIGYAYAPIGGWSPIRLFHVGVLHMDSVFALWNVLKMVETIDTGAKSLYFLKIGTAENFSI